MTYLIIASLIFALFASMAAWAIMGKDFWWDAEDDDWSGDR